MSDRTYYVICEDNCKFEGMTKEQIYDAIAEATGATPTPVDSAFITKIKEQNASKNMKFWKGTEAQYNAIATKNTDTVYIIVSNASEAPKLTNSTSIETSLNNLIAQVSQMAGNIIQKDTWTIKGTEINKIYQYDSAVQLENYALHKDFFFGADIIRIEFNTTEFPGKVLVLTKEDEKNHTRTGNWRYFTTTSICEKINTSGVYQRIEESHALRIKEDGSIGWEILQSVFPHATYGMDKVGLCDYFSNNLTDQESLKLTAYKLPQDNV